jgi:hypothetical protein
MHETDLLVAALNARALLGRFLFLLDVEAENDRLPADFPASPLVLLV